MLEPITLAATRIGHTVSRLIEEHHLPGVSVGVVSGEELILAEGFGFADIESRTPMTPEHRQRIASITKTMVSLCAMALVDEGRLTLQSRIVDLLPDIPFNGPAESLTVWHLLTHTGGIGEAPDIKYINDPFQLLFTQTAPAETLVEGYGEGFTIEVEPGTKWAYANHGYFLLGEIISRVEGASVADVVRRRIFEPLGMTGTDMLDQAPPGLSTGYHRTPGDDERELMLRAGRGIPDERTVDGHNIRGKYLPEWGHGAAGGVQSTIPDMLRYASALLRKSKGIVRAETFEKMVSPQFGYDPRLASWGLGFAVHSYFGQRFFGHGGSAFGGWNSYLAVFPDDDLAVLVHMNLVYDHFDAIRSRIIQAALGAPDNAVGKHLLEANMPTGAPGVYEAPNPGPLTNFRVVTGTGSVQVSSGEHGLVLHARRGPWKHGVPMVPADPSQPDLFALDTGDPDPPRVVAVRDIAGRVMALHFGGGFLWTMHRNDDVPPWA